MDVPVAIVGGGIMGLGAAWALGRRGVRCAVLDPLPRRTEHNASNDESKVFRLAYRERADYARLALASLGGWRSLERAARRSILDPCGVLALGRAGDGASFSRTSGPVLEALGRAPEVLDAQAIAARHPAFAGGGFDHGLLDRDGGVLDPPAALESLEAEATGLRAKVIRGAAVLGIEPAQGGRLAVRIAAGTIRADRVIVAAGHRAPLLLPELAPLLRCTRQPEFAFAAPPERAADYAPPRLPVFAAFEDNFYGFPARQGAVKVADHRKGPEVAWDPPRDPPTAEEERGVRAWLARAMPGLAAAPLARSRLCHYDNTADDDFLLGHHPARPGVILAAGFSGHGFKFAPAVGEALADLATGRELGKDWAACDPRRVLRG